jgi:hypothetical protein
VLLIGWSLVEGLGAALVMPAIVSLIAGTYSGKQRALGLRHRRRVAGAAIAAGPLIGGWVTTELSWRYVFAGERVIVAAILLCAALSAPARSSRARSSTWSASRSSALGLGLVRVRILKSSEWGLIEPRGALTIGGERSRRSASRACRSSSWPGLGFLAASRSGRSGASGRAGTRCWTGRCCGSAAARRAVHACSCSSCCCWDVLRPARLPAGSCSGSNAFDTGKRLVPACRWRCSSRPCRAAASQPSFAPKRGGQAGLAGASPWRAVALLARSNVELNEADFATRARVFGVGAGADRFPAGQRDHVLRRPGQDPTRRAACRAPAQNLGASLGTALIGAVLIAALTATSSRASSRTRISRSGARSRSPQIAAQGLEIVPSTTSSRRAREAGLPATKADSAGRRLRQGPAPRARAGDRAVRHSSRLLSLWFTRGLRAGAVMPTSPQESAGCAGGPRAAARMRLGRDGRGARRMS